DLIDPVAAASAALECKLSKSMQLSGSVTDETGEPIEGATVNIYIPHDSTSRQRNQFLLKTDAKGKWSSPAIPDPAPRKPYFQIQHPDFIGDESYIEAAAPLEQLRDGSAIMVLKKGVDLAGVV